MVYKGTPKKCHESRFNRDTLQNRSVPTGRDNAAIWARNEFLEVPIIIRLYLFKKSYNIAPFQPAGKPESVFMPVMLFGRP